MDIDVSGGGEVSLHRGLVETDLENGLGEFAFSSDDLIAERRDVVEVVGIQLRSFDFIERKHVEVFLWDEPRHVRIEGSVGQEERLVVFLLKGGDVLFAPLVSFILSPVR